MVRIKTKLPNGQEVEMGLLPVGRSGSFTDHAKPGTEILVIQSKEDCAELYLSKAGYSVAIPGSNLLFIDTPAEHFVLEKKFTGECRRKFMSRFGVECELILTFEKIPVNNSY